MSRMTLRLPDSLRALLEAQSKREGVSLNQYIVYALARQATLAHVVEVVPEEQVAEQERRFNALLHRLGTASHSHAREVLSKRANATRQPDVNPASAARVRTALAAKRRASRTRRSP